MKLKNAPGRVNFRRMAVLDELQERLKTTPEESKSKIEKQIAILKLKIVDPAVAFLSKRKKYRGAK